MANGKIYVNQSSLRLTLDTSVVLTGATTLQIKYKKPDAEETIGFWAATIDTDVNKLFYEFTSNELDISGLWAFWAYVVFADGRNAPGEPVNVKVYEQGT